MLKETLGFLHAYASLILCMHSNFQKPKQGKFSTFMFRFGTNPTSPGDCSKPLFSHQIKPYMVYFQKIQKTYTAKTPPGDFKVTTPEIPLLSQQMVTSKGIPVPYTNLQLNPYPYT